MHRQLSLFNIQVDGHGAEMGPELDEEMEKVFAMDTGEKFDVARLGSPSESDRDRDRRPSLSRYGDRDFNRKYYFFSCRFYLLSFRFGNKKSCIIWKFLYYLLILCGP